MEFSFISPEVTVASIGPDLCVFPVTKELRRKTGMEAPGGSEGFCVCASPLLMPCRAVQGEPAGMTADVEKPNTNARNVSVLLAI